MFDLVAGVEDYPEFLPWCIAARIRKRDGTTIWADLMIGFKMVRERFTSKVMLSPPGRIDVTYAEGMIMHHQQAVEMSDIILDKSGVDPDVVEMAKQIKQAQGPEIKEMQTWLEDWGQDDSGHDGHSGDSGYGVQRRGLAGAVGAEKRHHRPPGHLERHVGHPDQVAVAYLEMVDLEQRRAQSCLTLRRPR